MRSKQAEEGVTRVVDAAEEKFNELLEMSGFTDEDVLKYQEEKEKGEEEGSPEEGESNASAGGDENTMPTPENMEGGGEGAPQNGMDMAALQAGMEGGAAPAAEIPPEAQQMGAGMEGVAAGAPDTGAVAQGGGGLSPEEEEILRQQQQAAAAQQ